PTGSADMWPNPAGDQGVSLVRGAPRGDQSEGAQPEQGRRAMTSVRGDQAMRSDIVPGGVFPDYALPDHTGTVRTLSELQGRGPLILTLARGHYCPKEHQQHLEMATLLQPKAAVAYTRIVTISTDDHHELQEFRAS